tara:strand:- start:964 stop:1104 length:141 start_codon:yes stop_codon:yes gene_type:complete
MRNDFEEKNAVRMVPRGGIEPPTQGFSVIPIIEQGDEIYIFCSQNF